SVPHLEVEAVDGPVTEDPTDAGSDGPGVGAPTAPSDGPGTEAPTDSEAPADSEALIAPSDGTGWRTRVRLQVADDGTVGPFAARSHRVIPVDDLPLATPELQAVAPLTERFPGERRVDVVTPSTGNP